MSDVTRILEAIERANRRQPTLYCRWFMTNCGDWLLGEDMFARRNRGLHVHRPEMRRCGQQHDVGKLDDFPVGIEANELPRFRDIDSRRHLFLFLERFETEI